MSVLKEPGCLFLVFWVIITVTSLIQQQQQQQQKDEGIEGQIKWAILERDKYYIYCL